MSSTVERIRETTLAALDPVLTTDGKWFDRGFTLVLTAFVAVLLAQTFQYNERSQLVPLIVGVPTLLLLLGLLALQFSERAAARFEALTAGDVLGVEERVGGIQDQSTETASVESGQSQYGARADAVTMAGWVLLLFGLVLLIGFTVGVPAYLLLAYRVRADKSWPRTLGYTALIWGFIIVIFVQVLNTPLYPGLLEVRLPFFR